MYDYWTVHLYIDHAFFQIYARISDQRLMKNVHNLRHTSTYKSSFLKFLFIHFIQVSDQTNAWIHKYAHKFYQSEPFQPIFFHYLNYDWRRIHVIGCCLAFETEHWDLTVSLLFKTRKLVTLSVKSHVRTHATATSMLSTSRGGIQMHREGTAAVRPSAVRILQSVRLELSMTVTSSPSRKQTWDDWQKHR